MATTKSGKPLSLGRRAAIFAAALGIGFLVSSVSWAAGGSSTPSTPSVPSPTMEMSAADYYNQGLKHRDKAWELEKKAAATQGKAAEKLLNKAQKEYEKAVKAQRNAVSKDSVLYQAHSSLGYALRKIGEYDESIAAYNRSLSIAPGYPEAIEYRAEAYLGLNRLDEAKEAYLLLVREDQARADELMTAMKRWLEQQQDSASQVSASDLEEFASWVEERADIAGHIAMVRRSGAREW